VGPAVCSKISPMSLLFHEEAC